MLLDHNKNVQNRISQAIDELVGNRIDAKAAFWGSIYLMAATKTPRQLTDADLAAYNQVIVDGMTEKGVIVITSETEISQLVGIADDLIYSSPADHVVLKPGPIKTGVKLALKALASRSAGPNSHLPPVLFGGTISPEDEQAILSDYRANPALQNRVDIQRTRYFRQALNEWCSCWARTVDDKSPIATDTISVFFTEWKTKILSLDEFGGTQNETEVQLSDLEKIFLRELRSDAMQLPLFKDGEIQRTDVVSQFERTVLGDDSDVSWKGSKLGDELAKWLRRKMKDVPVDQLRQAELVPRRQAAIDFIVMDLRIRYKWPSNGHKETAINAVAAMLEKSLSLQSTGPPSRLEDACRKYLDLARVGNPVFKELGTDRTEQSLWLEYRQYSVKGRSPLEQIAYDTFASELLKAAGISEPK